jgi:tRNA-specific 2-thiouridylase
VAADGHHVELLRGKDRQKDQSYVLYALSQDQLTVSLFPLGELIKSEVREMARGYDLPTSDRADSQDLCFLAGEDYREFITRYSPDLDKAGRIVDMHGNSLGRHQGLAKYTIGQRKGIGISSPYPYYVIRKDMQENLLIVGHESDLGRCALIASEINWLAGDKPQESFRADVKVRYTAKEAAATITPLSEMKYKVQFDEPQLGITPGQAVVFYNGDIVLGGGIIVID